MQILQEGAGTRRGAGHTKQNWGALGSPAACESWSRFPRGDLAWLKPPLSLGFWTEAPSGQRGLKGTYPLGSAVGQS